MVNLELINNGKVNQLVLKTILEQEEPEFLEFPVMETDFKWEEIPLRPEHKVCLKECPWDGTLYHISLGGELWAEVYQYHNDYWLVGLS